MEHKKTKKILIVDDQESWQESIFGVLEEIECTVHFAKTYHEAQSKLESEDYDLSIIDIRLEEAVDYNVEGIDLLEWIYENQQGHPPVIILTGYANEALRQKAEWYNAYAFLEKSYKRKGFDFDRELFLKTVKEALH